MAAVNDPVAAFQSEGGASVQPVEVDLTKLTALSPEVIMNQATVSLRWADDPFRLSPVANWSDMEALRACFWELAQHEQCRGNRIWAAGSPQRYAYRMS